MFAGAFQPFISFRYIFMVDKFEDKVIFYDNGNSQG